MGRLPEASAEWLAGLVREDEEHRRELAGLTEGDLMREWDAELAALKDHPPPAPYFPKVGPRKALPPLAGDLKLSCRELGARSAFSIGSRLMGTLQTMTEDLVERGAVRGGSAFLESGSPDQVWEVARTEVSMLLDDLDAAGQDVEDCLHDALEGAEWGAGRDVPPGTLLMGAECGLLGRGVAEYEQTLDRLEESVVHLAEVYGWMARSVGGRVREYRPPKRRDPPHSGVEAFFQAVAPDVPVLDVVLGDFDVRVAVEGSLSALKGQLVRECGHGSGRTVGL